ncbi:hypothetical protein BZG35_16365 [Brevundimonas sp. LM2]|uniref:MipA/OmpV family protein n=1 Tax=Brevundimonas sp. LM2 TaxID=1938605 RepID=UPI000983ED18|nr:MipA/OmpV family protein [Brevundimonas sp. LM2]AQR63056.1 hypothetical protein BZG35_16365 [Brevundimonas sp. LM2]
MRSSISSLGASVALGALLIAHPVFAQDRPEADRPEQGFHPILGVAGLYRPEFRGSDDYEFQPRPFVGFRYGLGGTTLSMQGADFELDLVPNGRFEAGPVIGYRSGRDDDISNEIVRLLPTIDGALEGGAFAKMNWEVGGGTIAAGVKFMADLGDAHEGYSVGLDTSYSAPITERLSYSVGANIVWADDSYMQTYFGVDAAGAVASGLTPFQAEAGLESAGLSANLRYQLNERWGMALFASYDRLLGDAADTPIVTEQGSENQMQVGFAIFRAF